MTSSRETVMASGEFTGRKAAAIATKSQNRYLAAILQIPVTLLPFRRVTFREQARKMPVGVRRPGRTGTMRSRSGNRYPRLYSAVGTALFALVCANNLSEAEECKTIGRTQQRVRFEL
jgi:hypothetical protein